MTYHTLDIIFVNPMHIVQSYVVVSDVLNLAFTEVKVMLRMANIF